MHRKHGRSEPLPSDFVKTLEQKYLKASPNATFFVTTANPAMPSPSPSNDAPATSQPELTSQVLTEDECNIMLNFLNEAGQALNSPDTEPTVLVDSDEKTKQPELNEITQEEASRFNQIVSNYISFFEKNQFLLSWNSIKFRIWFKGNAKKDRSFHTTHFLEPSLSLIKSCFERAVKELDPEIVKEMWENNDYLQKNIKENLNQFKHSLSYILDFAKYPKYCSFVEAFLMQFENDKEIVKDTYKKLSNLKKYYPSRELNKLVNDIAIKHFPSDRLDIQTFLSHTEVIVPLEKHIQSGNANVEQTTSSGSFPVNTIPQPGKK